MLIEPPSGDAEKLDFIRRRVLTFLTLKGKGKCIRKKILGVKGITLTRYILFKTLKSA